LAPEQLRTLRALGETLAYNSYGDTEADLIVHPATLYRTMSRYADPFEFVAAEAVCRRIADRRREDLQHALGSEPTTTLARARLYILPDEPWSRRVRGAFVNELAQRAPDVAHAVLTSNAQGGYTASVRAPLATGTGADTLCRKFASGGGRVSAAGINHLPRDQVPALVRELERSFS
jgi:hypothetical protein